MGVDTEIYRVRIGTFVKVYLQKSKIQKYKYKGYTSGTDVHLHTFVVCAFMLCIFSAFYCVVYGQHYIEDNYAVASYDVCDQKTAISTGETALMCKYGGPYSSFAQRLITLSSDVEMNPGPSNDVSNENTERILAAISKTSEEIKEVKCAMQSVQQEISAIKDEMKEMRAQVRQVELAQISTDYVQYQNI